MQKLTIIKIGGNVIDHETVLSVFLDDFAALKGLKILVHGGGKVADQLCTQLNIVPQKIEGRRVTDAATLDVVTMVYAGLLNKKIVAALQARNCQSMGLCGADLNVIQAHKRTKGSIDYGFAGDVDAVNTQSIAKLLRWKVIPIFSAITHDKKGQLLNTNADTIATTIATALSPFFATTLFFCFEKNGVLANPKDDNSVISSINFDDFQRYKASGVVSEGMIPKLDNAFDAISKGVRRVVIGGVTALKTKNDIKGTILQQ